MKKVSELSHGGKALPSAFFRKKTELVAQGLLGKILYFHSPRTQSWVSGRIVETEAYLGRTDPACHSFHGKVTERTKTFYLPGGHIYVYLIYGMYNCLNFITRSAKDPEAVLIRALEPLVGTEDLITLEGKNKTKDLLNGPGKLCRAFGIDRSLNAMSLEDSPMKIVDDGFKLKKSDIVKTSRIGVAYAEEAAHWPLRYYISGSPFISKK